MRQADVFCRGVLAGTLSKDPAGKYYFQYALEYLASATSPAISLSFPKRQAPYESLVLFPFFFGLLAEGDDKTLQCRILRIDESDHFTRLLRTCGAETIGGVTIREASPG